MAGPHTEHLVLNGHPLYLKSFQTERSPFGVTHYAETDDPVHPYNREVLRERLAQGVHDMWSHWMTHLFQTGKVDECGNYVLPWSLVERWQRQIATPYSELSESEKETDRAEADKILGIFNV